MGYPRGTVGGVQRDGGDHPRSQQGLRGRGRAAVVEAPSGLAGAHVGMLLTAAAILLPAYGAPLGEAFARRMGFGSAFVLAWQIGQWPVIFGFVLIAFDLLYYFAPHRPRAHWRWLRPGTLIAIALWLAASLALKFYVTNVGHYNVAYGSLGAVIVLLLWFYLTGIAILAGAEINAELENVKTGSGMEVKSLLVGQSADPAVQEEIRRFLTGRDIGQAPRNSAVFTNLILRAAFSDGAVRASKAVASLLLEGRVWYETNARVGTGHQCAAYPVGHS
jgi:hypothetical protein